MARYFRLATAKRQAEELYDLRRDPHQLENVAGRLAHADAQRQQLEGWLRERAIRARPRMTTDGIR